jgi:flagellar operon protein
MVDAINGLRPGAAGGIDAGVALGGASRGAGAAGDGGFALQFSKHAAKRFEQRGLDLDSAQMGRLERAVGQAEAKGSKDSLILLDDLALVVSVQNRTVVTAMDEQSSKEHVFTNIDSVVIAPR